MINKKRSNLYLYLIFAVSVFSFIFSGAYNPNKIHSEHIFLPKRKIIKVSLYPDNNKKNNNNYVIPVKSRNNESTKLKRKTRFISKTENEYSGKTTDKQSTTWVNPEEKKSTGKKIKNKRKTKKLIKDTKRQNDFIKDKTSEKKSIFPIDRTRIYKYSKEQWDRFEKSLSAFQELPYIKIKSDLLINFNSSGKISLGTLAYKYSEYFFNMVKKISKEWHRFFPVFQHYYGLLKDGEILVNFQLDIDGNVKWVKLIKSYGQNSLDHACITAIKEAKSFGPIPKDFREKGEMTIPFLFVYKGPKKKLKMFH